MAKNDQTPVITRLATMLLHRTVDYVITTPYLSSSEQQAKRVKLIERLAMLHTAPRKPAKRASLSLCMNTGAITPHNKQKPKCRKISRANLLPQYRDGHDIDKMISAALALWYNKRETPGASYRFTVNVDHRYKKTSFDYLRDELSRIFCEHSICDLFLSFEVSTSGRLHCHGMANIPDSVDIETLRQALQKRFGNSEEIRNSLRGKNKIVHIDRVTQSIDKRKSPEKWASYAIGDAVFTRAQLNWKTIYYMSASLKAPAKAVYEWLRKPDIDRLPFTLESTNCKYSNVEQAFADLLDPASALVANVNEFTSLKVSPLQQKQVCRVRRSWKLSNRNGHSVIGSRSPTVAELADRWNQSIKRWIQEADLKCRIEISTVRAT